MTRSWGTALEPPLDPGPDEARSSLRRELLHPEYHEEDLLRRFLEWVARMLDRGLEAAAGAPALATFATMVVGLALLLGLGWLASRTRRARDAERRPVAVLTDEGLTAAKLRRRAEAALVEGRPEDALVDAFRALAVRQVERGRLEDSPGATAHEVARTLAGEFPGRRDAVEDAARLFDAVLYGDRPASAAQATAVLALDDDLVVLR